MAHFCFAKWIHQKTMFNKTTLWKLVLNSSFFANQFSYPFIDLVPKAILCLPKNEQNPLFYLVSSRLILDTYGSFIWLSKVNYNEQIHTLFQGSCIKLHCLNCMRTPQVQVHVYTCTYLYIYDHIIYWKTLNLGAFQI